MDETSDIPHTTQQPSGPGTDKAAGATGSGTDGAIDIEKLADRVYQLMKAELRLDRTRYIGTRRRQEADR